MTFVILLVNLEQKTKGEKRWGQREFDPLRGFSELILRRGRW